MNSESNPDRESQVSITDLKNFDADCENNPKLTEIYIYFLCHRIRSLTFSGYDELRNKNNNITNSSVSKLRDDKQFLIRAKEFFNDLLTNCANNPESLKNYCKTNGIKFPKLEDLNEVKRLSIIFFRKYGDINSYTQTLN